MNIKIQKLNESHNTKSDLKESDLFDYIDKQFPDNAISWKNATMEIVDMANWIYNVVSDNLGKTISASFQDVTKSKTPKEWNKKHKQRIKDGFSYLKPADKKDFFNTFGHWIMQPINESATINLEDDKVIEDVMKLKSNQFKFDCGIFMGTIKSGLTNKFGLSYHVLNSTDVNTFIESVKSFMTNSESKLTENDIAKLKAHYIKYTH